MRAGCADHKFAIAETLEPVKELLKDVLQRLGLKGEKFEVLPSASEADINELFEVLLNVEAMLTREDTCKKSLEKLPSLKKFIEHCCVFTKYSITIKKCGKMTVIFADL